MAEVKSAQIAGNTFAHEGDLKIAVRDSASAHPAVSRLRHRLRGQGQQALHADYRAYSRSCFPAGVAVLLADGTTKTIELVAVGDMVMGFDGANQVPVRVEAIDAPVRDHLCILSFADKGHLQLTDEHPVFTSRGWKALSPGNLTIENPLMEVGMLEIGDLVLTASGEWMALTSLTVVQGAVQTYNIQRLTPHNTFYVNGFLVHSKSSEAPARMWRTHPA